MHRESSLAGQCQSEHETLKNIKDALRATLAWSAPDIGGSQRHASVLFIIRALQRHLERQLALEEQGGYLETIVEEEKPNLVTHAQRLREEHQEFRESLRTLLPRFERASAQERRFERLADEVMALLERLEKHESEEADLLQEVFLTDEGGEG